MRRQIVVSVILIAVLLVGGAGISRYLIHSRPSPPTREVTRPPLLVKALAVQPQTVVEPIIGYGTARADRFTRISAQVSGEIVELGDWLKPGVEVHKEQTLLRIDEEEYVSRLTSAESRLAADQAQLAQLEVEEGNTDRLIAIAGQELEIAQRDFDRVKELLESGESHPREHDQYYRILQQVRSAMQVLQNRKALLPSRRAQVQAVCRTRQAEVDLAQLNVNRCKIIAPFDGRIDEVAVELGDRVQIGRELVTLLNPDLIEVPIELLASVRHRVRVGARCRLSVESTAGVDWAGQVKRMSPTASENTRTFKLYVEVNNTGQAQTLVPGFFVRAVIDGPTLEDVLIVPRGAIQQGHVFVYNAGKAHPRGVKIVRHLLDQTVVTGLQPGEVVITSNLDALYEGVPVRLEPEAGEPFVSSTNQYRDRKGAAYGWVAHRFSGGGHECLTRFLSPTAKAMGHPRHPHRGRRESADHSGPPPLK
ncbi:MAG: efflux RND transporter periplasmic adaptor subunit, partial [Phycisphaerae bacterium]|nr:efflux RND transporter periplasmic adaptor subunit [Phycisphaerae bacterium]